MFRIVGGSARCTVRVSASATVGELQVSRINDDVASRLEGAYRSTGSQQHKLTSSKSAIEASDVKVPAAQQVWKAGFPPKPVPTAGREHEPLSAVGLRPGDTITVDAGPPPSAKITSAPVVPLASAPGTLQRHVVPADNSCLFASIGVLLEPTGAAAAASLRETVAGLILSDPDTFVFKRRSRLVPR
jgi:hypothetical protein